MNKLRHNEIDPRLVVLLEELKPAPERNPKLAARARAQFLAEAVSVRNERRLSLWTIFQQKEQFAMKLIMSMLVIAGLLFGGNATVSAAQDDLPNEPLYPIKMLSEELNLWLVSDPVAKIEMLMGQAQIRTEEMAALVEQGITPPGELRIRVQERIQRALQLAADLDEPTATLEQIHTQLQTQEQLMSRLQDGTCADCEPILQQTQEMLRTQLRQIESGFDHPQTSPNQNQNQNQIRTTQTPIAVEETVLPPAFTPARDGTGQQNGDGNPSAATPVPQNNSTNQNGGTQNGPDNNSNQQNGNDNGNEDGNGNGSGEGGGTGSGDDSGQGSGGQGGKP